MSTRPVPNLDSQLSPQLIVQKYGGASLSDPKKLKQIAAQISDKAKRGQQIVVVVSAMGATTNQLIELAGQVSKRPAKREMDMLLSAGERISMSLLSIALNDLGCAAISFTGSQAGILTDAEHVNAYIKEINAPRVKEALNQKKVVVLAGFQGVSPTTKEITTLGRGGSDLTAISMAAYLKAGLCEILKDVDGVFTADPHLVPQAKAIPTLGYQELMEMTFWGAKVLQYRSAELAFQQKVPLYIGPARENGGSTGGRDRQQGTKIILREAEMLETSKILGLNSHEKILKIHSQFETEFETIKKFEKLLIKNEIPFPQILLSENAGKNGSGEKGDSSRDGGVTFYMTGAKEVLNAIEETLTNSKDFTLASEKLSSVTATCLGTTSAQITKSICEKLSLAQIPLSHIFMSPMSITTLIPTQHRERALKELHQLI